MTNNNITRREFHEMELRIVHAINETAVDYAGIAEKCEANRLNIIRLGGLNTVLTGIGSTIAALIGIRD